MGAVKSSNTVIQGELAVNKTSKITFNSNGQSDISDANNPKGDATVNFSLTSSDNSASASANVNVIFVGGELYLKINNLSLAGPSIASGLDSSKISNIWLKIDQDSINVLTQASGDQIPADILQMDNTGLTKKVQSLIASENLISFDKQLADENIGNTPTYHYVLKISKDKINGLLLKILALQQTQDASVESSAALVQSMVGPFLNKFTDAVGDLNMDVWIGKSDSMLYQIKINKIIALNKIIPSSTAQIEVKFSEMISNFNKPVVEKAPEGAQKIESVILPMLENGGIKNDLNQIGSISAMLKSTPEGYQQLCNRGLLNGYLTTFGTNLIQLNNDIIGQGARKPVCFSGLYTFCVSTQLADGSFLCIDAANVLGNKKCISANTICNDNE
jgi:hypothetical protein